MCSFVCLKYIRINMLKLILMVCRKKSKSAPASGTATISRSYSASDLSLAGTSLIHKTNIGEARPITNRKLKRALSKSSQDLKSASVTPRVKLSFVSFLSYINVYGLSLLTRS